MRPIVRLAIKILILLIFVVVLVCLVSHFSSYFTRIKMENKIQPKIENWLHKIVKILFELDEEAEKRNYAYVQHTLKMIVHSVQFATYIYGANYLQYIANMHKNNELIQRLFLQQDATLTPFSNFQKENEEKQTIISAQTLSQLPKQTQTQTQNQAFIVDSTGVIRTKYDVWTAILEKINILSHKTKIYFEMNLSLNESPTTKAISNRGIQSPSITFLDPRTNDDENETRFFQRHEEFKRNGRLLELIPSIANKKTKFQRKEKNSNLTEEGLRKLIQDFMQTKNTKLKKTSPPAISQIVKNTSPHNVQPEFLG